MGMQVRYVICLARYGVQAQRPNEIFVGPKNLWEFLVSRFVLKLFSTDILNLRTLGELYKLLL